MAIRTIPHSKCGTRRRVRGIVSLLPGRQMTSGCSARGWRDIQRIIPVDMALTALHGRVLVCQRKSRRVMVELTVRPFGNRMASSTGRSRCRKT